jgi:hypothetical protein
MPTTPSPIALGHPGKDRLYKFRRFSETPKFFGCFFSYFSKFSDCSDSRNQKSCAFCSRTARFYGCEKDKLRHRVSFLDDSKKILPTRWLYPKIPKRIIIEAFRDFFVSTP